MRMQVTITVEQTIEGGKPRMTVTPEGVPSPWDGLRMCMAAQQYFAAHFEQAAMAAEAAAAEQQSPVLYLPNGARRQ